MYTSYQFYTTEYYGDIISESPFAKYCSRAGDVLDSLTFGRVNGHLEVTVVDNVPEVSSDFDEDTTKAIQKSVCALMDAIYMIDETMKQPVKSKSSGNESISYAENVYVKAVQNSGDKMKLYYQTVSEYLAGTGLLYAGVE